MLRTLSALSCLAVLSSCAPSVGPESTLVITGSSTIAPLASEIARRFEETEDGARVDVQTGGSSRGITDVRERRADVGMTSRALYADERDGVREHVIAWDGVALVVHESNAVRALSDEQVRAIFRGEIERWTEVGGADAEIVVVNRADGRSELDLFAEYLGVEKTDMVADVIGGENQQVVKTVTANPQAISYLSLGTAEYEIENGTPLALLPLGGVRASSDAVRAGRFPLARPLILITPDEPSELARRFVAYALDEAVHDLVRDQSFVPAG